MQSVHKALQIIDVLAEESRDMSLTEISQKMGWPKSTVHGLLSTMREFGYVAQSPENGQYRLGVRLFELGNAVERSWNVPKISKPIMAKLSNLSGEMVQLGTEQNGEVLYLEKVESTHLLRIVSEVGTRLPLHCTGIGKVLLAYKKPAEQNRIIASKGLAPLTSRTITNISTMQKELKTIKENGYAVDNGEVMEGLRCVAAPIYDANGEVNYAISISGTYNNMEGTNFEKATRLIKRAANSISYGLGYSGNDDSMLL